MLSAKRYQALVKDLQRIIAQGKRDAELAAAQHLVQAYWQLGDRLRSEDVQDYAGNSSRLYTELSRDLGIDSKTLRRIVSFRRMYTKAPKLNALTWTLLPHLAHLGRSS